MTNAEARFSKSLRPRKPEGSLGRTAQDGRLDSHTAPKLCVGGQLRSEWPAEFGGTEVPESDARCGLPLPTPALHWVPETRQPYFRLVQQRHTPNLVNQCRGAYIRTRRQWSFCPGRQQWLLNLMPPNAVNSSVNSMYLASPSCRTGLFVSRMM